MFQTKEQGKTSEKELNEKHRPENRSSTPGKEEKTTLRRVKG